MPTISSKDFFKKGNVSVVGSDNQHFENLDGPGLFEQAWNGLKNYGSNVGKDYYKSASDIVNSVKEAGEGKQSPLSAALQSAGSGVDAVFAPVTEAVSPVVNKTFKTLNPVVDFITGLVGGEQKPGETEQNQQKATDYTMQKYNELLQQHPEAVKNAEAAFKVITALMGEKTANDEGANLDLAKSAQDIKGSAGEITNKIKGAVSESIPSMEGTGEMVKNAATSAEDMLTKIEPSVETELLKSDIPKEVVQERLKTYTDAAKEAMADNSKSTPLELAGQKAEDALSNIKEQLNEAGKAKQVALEENGTKTVSTGSTVEKFNQLLEKRLGTVINEKGELTNAQGRKSIVGNSNSDSSLIKSVRDTLGGLGENPTLQEVNDAIDGIQGDLYKTRGVGAEPINGKTEAVVKEVIHELNERAKDVGGDAYRQANSDYSSKRDVYDVLNKGLGIDANKGAALMKQLFSPNGTLARKLFAEIKALTGIDLVNEATLAKFAMEQSGDVRQASLLKQVLNNPSKVGVMKGLYDITLGKLENPVGKAERMIKKRKK